MLKDWQAKAYEMSVLFYPNKTHYKYWIILGYDPSLHVSSSKTTFNTKTFNHSYPGKKYKGINWSFHTCSLYLEMPLRITVCGGEAKRNLKLRIVTSVVNLINQLFIKEALWNHEFSNIEPFGLKMNHRMWVALCDIVIMCLLVPLLHAFLLGF